MFRKLLATTALATLLASGAYAQTATTTTDPAAAPATENAAPAAPVAHADGSLAANIIGEDVYNGSGDDAESIGKVSDIVFDKDGQAKSVVIGVGGFLGVGSKDVAFDYDKVKWAEKNGDRWLVAETTKDALTALPEFDETPYEPAASQASANTGMAPATTPDTTAMAPADNSDAAAPATDTAQTAPATTAPATTAPADTAAAPVTPAEGSLASNIIGEDVYNGTGDDAEKIGDINDIVLSKAGKAEQFVIGVGGFLGVGEKNVAFDYDKAKWTEKDGDRWLVVQGTKDELKGLPAFDRKAYDPAPATTAAGSDTPATVTPATDTAANEPADATAPAAADQTAEAPATTAPAATAPAETDQTAAAPADDSSTDATQTAATDKSALSEVPADKISADNLIGTTVYGANDADVGEIGDVVLSSDNSIDAVIVDVGGFLGIGEKSVAIGMDKLKFMADEDGNQYLYTNFTKEQLESQAAYDKGSYAEQRDEQRMIVQ